MKPYGKSPKTITVCCPPPSSCRNASASHIPGLAGCPWSRIPGGSRSQEKSSRTRRASVFSSYQQVEGGAASDGNGFDRPPEFKDVFHLQAGLRAGSSCCFL